MATDDRDESFFAQEMARQGVVPLAPGGRRQSKGQPKARSGARDGVKGGAKGGAKSAPASVSTVATSALTSLEKEHRETLGALELERHNAAVEKQARAAEQKAWAGERATWAKERDALEEEAKKWQSKHAELLAERQALQRQLGEARHQAEARVPLRDVLQARGCSDMDEEAQVLQQLLELWPKELLDAIELASPQPLAAVLEDRVALVAENLDLDGIELGGAESSCAVLRVSPERCEISGGSDIRVEFRRFVDACRKVAAERVTIVGGSPAYRKQLKTLAGPYHKELRLDLIPGNRRRERRRAESDVRSSSLVVIWGATELDHSVSDVYTQGNAPVLRVPHRGISRMLSHVAESLAKRDKSDAKGSSAKSPKKRRGKRPKKR